MLGHLSIHPGLPAPTSRPINTNGAELYKSQMIMKTTYKDMVRDATSLFENRLEKVTGKWILPSPGAQTVWCRNPIGSNDKHVDTITSSKI